MQSLPGVWQPPLASACRNQVRQKTIISGSTTLTGEPSCPAVLRHGALQDITSFYDARKDARTGGSEPAFLFVSQVWKKKAMENIVTLLKGITFLFIDSLEEEMIRVKLPFFFWS